MKLTKNITVSHHSREGDEHGQECHGNPQNVEERKGYESLVSVQNVARIDEDVDRETRQRHLLKEHIVA